MTQTQSSPLRQSRLHPNTKTLISVWQRMSAGRDDLRRGPQTRDHPDLIGRLFIMQDSGDGAWLFRNAGETLSRLLGRALSDHDFLDLWNGPDRAMVTGFTESVRAAAAPGMIRAHGETLTGQRVGVELLLAPLPGGLPDRRQRMLGLYQTLEDAHLLGRPIWRHRVSALYPPAAPDPANTLQLVASND